MARKILYSTLESASFNTILQIFFRCITFFLNAFVLRYVSQAELGVMNVRLLLLESTIVFLSREAFRRAALSQTDSQSWSQILNLMWLTVPLSIVVSLTFSLVWLYILSVPSLDITPHYAVGVWSISLSCIIRMFTEPLCIVSQAFLFNKLQVVLNSLMIIIRTIIFVVWILANPKQALIAFSVCQIIANVFFCVGFYVYFYVYIKDNNRQKSESALEMLNKNKYTNEVNNVSKKKKDEVENKYNEDLLDSINGSNERNHENFGDFQTREGRPLPKCQRQNSMVGFDEPFPFKSLMDFLPRPVKDQKWIHPNSAQLTWSFLKQGVLKQILTEGERYVMTLFSVMTFKEQGIYDVVNNLGSLAARFLFRPFEDSMYFYFTQSVKRDVNIKDQNEERMKEASMVLFQVLNCITGLGLVIFTFGQSYSALLLQLYGGEAIASEGKVWLRTHSFSVLLMGINGITECYAFSTMTAHQLNEYNYLMAMFSVSFLVISWGLTRLFGGVGFIFANCCNMLARIIHSVVFIKSRYAESSYQPWLGLLPKKYFFMSLCLSLIITKTSENHLPSLPHFLIGVVCFSIVSLVWCFEKKDLVLLAINKWKNRKNKTE